MAKKKLGRMFGLLRSAEGLCADDKGYEAHGGIRFKVSPDPKRSPPLDSIAQKITKVIKFSPLKPGMLGPGDRAPDLEVIRPDGTVQKLSALRGKPLLIFMVRVKTNTMYCPLCLPSLDQLDEMVGEFQRRNVQVLIVGSTTTERCADFREAVGLKKLPIHADPQWNVFNAFDVGSVGPLPLHAWVLLDADGIVRWVWRMTGPDPERALPMPTFALDRIDEVFSGGLAASAI